MEDFEMPKSRVYVLPDAQGRVTRLEGEYTLPDDLDGWVLIDEGDPCDRLNLAQSHYLPQSLYTEDGLLRYKLVDGDVVEREPEELDEDRAAMPKPEPTEAEKIAALLSENKTLKAQAALQEDKLTMLEDCILELGDQVYA